jgi:hypothetical protein
VIHLNDWSEFPRPPLALMEAPKPKGAKFKARLTKEFMVLKWAGYSPYYFLMVVFLYNCQFLRKTPKYYVNYPTEFY